MGVGKKKETKRRKVDDIPLGREPGAAYLKPGNRYWGKYFRSSGTGAVHTPIRDHRNEDDRKETYGDILVRLDELRPGKEPPAGPANLQNY